MIAAILNSEVNQQFFRVLEWIKLGDNHEFTDLMGAISLLSIIYGFAAVFLATRARIYLNGYWGFHLYKYDKNVTDFVKHGPYEKRRHPIYAGQIGLVVSTAIVSRSLAFAIFVLFVVWMNYRRAVNEEEHMDKHFKGYEEYKNRVGKMFSILF